jgi:hypothetical protein
MQTDRQMSNDEANTCFFDFSGGSQRTRENKKTDSLFYASGSVLITNHHIKVVDRIWEGYKATGETQDRQELHGLHCTTVAVIVMKVNINWTYSMHRGNIFFCCCCPVCGMSTWKCLVYF